MNSLDQLFDILKQLGEKKMVVYDREAGEFYLLSKLERTLVAEDKSQKQKIETVKQANSFSKEIAMEPPDISDEEKFFFETIG